MGEVAKLRSLPDVVAEYDAKLAAIPQIIADFAAAGDAVKVAVSVGGEYGQENINVGGTYARTLEMNLLRSAWQHVWRGLNLPTIASAKDKANWERAMAAPAPFTLDNLRATFGPYLENPRATILRGMAEVFADLDPAYKSHEKVKVGVKGLPKRVIVRGSDKIRDILNALAAYQGKPLASHLEISALMKDGNCLRDGGEVPDPFQSRYERDPRTATVPARGVWLKKFQNGNNHLFFAPDALADINRALAEYYGDVLADCDDADDDRPVPRHTGTAVAKDLQFYPTPRKVIDAIIDRADFRGLRVLEPSCGDGRMMDALRDAGAEVYGVEVDRQRAQMARNKGHGVMTHNFLTLSPQDGMAGDRWRSFDMVVMNPPFYGKHYAKHVRHAMRFLKDGGKLMAILPATARYDHGLLDELRPEWRDLPVGAFSESGTNVCTTIVTIRKREAA